MTQNQGTKCTGRVGLICGAGSVNRAVLSVLSIVITVEGGCLILSPYPIHPDEVKKRAAVALRAYTGKNTPPKGDANGFVGSNPCSNVPQVNNVRKWSYGCRSRLCPNCEARLATSAHHSLREVLIDDFNNGGRHLTFLTLTLPGSDSDIRHASLDEQWGYANEAWRRLWRFLRRKRGAYGAFVAFEVTYNTKRRWWHCHAHALVSWHSHTVLSRDDITPHGWGERFSMDTTTHKEWTMEHLSYVTKSQVYVTKVQGLHTEDVSARLEYLRTMAGKRRWRRCGSFIGANNVLKGAICSPGDVGVKDPVEYEKFVVLQFEGVKYLHFGGERLSAMEWEKRFLNAGGHI